MSFVVPSPKTWVDGDIPDYSELQTELFDAVNFLLNPPTVKVRQTVAQSISASTWTPLSFDGVELDTHGATSTADKTKVTPQVPGWYLGWCSNAWDTATGSFTVGRRDISPWLNNTTRIMQWTQPPVAFSGSTYPKPNRAFLVACNGTTDYIQVNVYQQSSTTMKTIANRTDYQPQLYLKWHCRL